MPLSHLVATAEQTLIRGLLPSDFAVASGPVRANAFLHDEEVGAVKTAIDGRKQDFSSGRAYARAALASLGMSGCIIPSRADRSPLWPEGIVGSITHSHGLVAAVVGWRRDYAGVGLDVESLERSLAKGIDRLIRTPLEQEQMQGLRFPAEIDPVRLVFSAKESIHKCVAPQSGVTLGFHDVELDLDLERQSFCARLLRADARLPDFRRIVGRFAFTSRFVMTSVWMAS
ncbi:MAG TPA: 4'-phosphopantetheinyl transferase superfamily protein [Longimicrobiales bacterium]|nr:4'-phosphopantetheinyl transferase superfamily protein [Longimicrobiales bacterium]